MGIQSKIRLGFVAIGILLFLSGIISSLELIRFNRSTHNVLEQNRNTVSLSKQMLDAVQEQNTALLMSITDTTRRDLCDSLIAKSRKDFDRALQSAQSGASRPDQLNPIRETATAYHVVMSQVTDDTDIHWFTDIYKTPYFNLTQAIKEFMVQTQQQTINYTAQLERNAYRSSMVGIIALGAGILLLAVFYFMLKQYFIRPVLGITKSLKGYIELKAPFTVEVDTKDEIRSLKNYINSLVESTKKPKL